MYADPNVELLDSFLEKLEIGLGNFAIVVA
jgi:hypothetical protein